MKALKIVTIIYIVFLYGITSYAQITLSEIFNPSLQESDGWIEITAAGSAQPFFINLYLTGSNTPIASSDDVFITGNYRFEELAAGEYTVIVYDREGCETIIAPIILEDEPRCDIDYYVNTLKHATSIDYREQTSIDDGEIEVIISDPDRYELTWQGPAGFISTENHLTDLPSGRFILTIIDMLNSECQVTEEFYITYCRQLTFDYRDLPSVEIGEADVTSPTSGACNGQITVPPVINRSDNAFSLTWYQQDALLASSNTIQNLCPGTYTLIVEDGCHPTQMFEYTLYDCTENPIILEPTNNCTDLDYEGAFSLSINGGENAVILPEWSETGNGRIYFAVDDRGCTAQHEFKYSEIGDWDIQYEVIKPFNGIGDPIVEITILNADGDQAPFNMVGYRNLIPVNVPFQVILEGVEAGSLPVDFENKNSCVRRVWFDITDCVNYEEKTPITLDVNIDYEGDQSAFVNANPSQSCSDMTNVQLLIQGGLAPYDIYISSPNNEDWNGFAFNDINEIEFIVENIPPHSNLDIRIVDDCSETINQYVEICNVCDIAYDWGDYTFSLGNSNGLEIKFNHACGESTFAQINPFNDEIGFRLEIDRDQIQDWELPITVSWPLDFGTSELQLESDGSILFLDNGNPISGNSISIDIPNDYRVDGDSFEFTVTRGDGCSVTFPFIYQEEEERSGIYVSGDFYSSQFDIPSELEEAYIGTVTCESCTPIDQSQFAGNPEETDCFNNRNSAIKFFKWIPSDDSNPCNGGGELVFQVLDPRDGDFNSVVIPIGANQSLFEVSNAGIGNSQTVGFNCLTGGACVFSSSVVSSVFNLDRPVAGSFCLEQEDFNNGSGSEREICDFRILETGARPDISISLSHDLTTDNYIYLKRFLIGIGLDFTISGAVGGPHNYCGADLIPDQWPIVNPNEEINLFFSGLGCLEDMNGQPFGSTNIDLTFGCGTFVSAQETETRHSTELETDITEETTIVAYPNPSTNFITISYSGPYDKMDLEIFDPLGRSIEDTEILKGEEKEVLGDKAPGIYTVVFSNGDGFSKTQKLIRVD